MIGIYTDFFDFDIEDNIFLKKEHKYNEIKLYKILIYLSYSEREQPIKCPN